MFHWVDKKQIVCPEVAEAGPVESASEFARWRAKDCRNLYIFKIRGPLKYAVDVAVKAEETPRVFLASQKVGEENHRGLAGMLEQNVKFFDPCLRRLLLLPGGSGKEKLGTKLTSMLTRHRYG